MCPLIHAIIDGSGKHVEIHFSIYFWLRQELKKCKCRFVCLSGEKCSRALNLHLSLSGQSQVSRIGLSELNS